MFDIFTKKKINEAKVANVFVNSIFNMVDEGFPLVASFINEDSEFVSTPNIQPENSMDFMLVAFAGNIKFIPEYFESYQDLRLTEQIISKLACALDTDKENMKKIIKELDLLFSKLNHPSKNTHYAMSKAVFHKYNLYQYQQDYFKNMRSPNPIFLKKLDEIMAQFIWDWDSFLDKYRVIE
jgi:hypothetical protein